MSRTARPKKRGRRAMESETRSKKKAEDSENSEDESEEEKFVSSDDDASAPKSKRLRAAMKKKKEGNPFNMEVIHHESIVIVAPKDADESDKIACFDMDWTLVKPKGAKAKFPRNRNDWEWMFNKTVVPKKLKALHDDGHRIVIISNQNGIGAGKQSEEDVTMKIIDLAQALDIPLTALLSTEKDIWRKPNPAMWDYFVEQYNDEKKVDLSASVYVGDAAGRPKMWDGNKKTKRDFSASDRKFAHNCGLTFHTPEPYFLGHKEYTGWEWRSIHPGEYLDSIKHLKPEKPSTWFDGSLPIARNDGNLDLVIMIGCPGSGKSTFAKRYLVKEGYEWVNRDTLKTQKKCENACKAALAAGTSVVVDNTNPNQKSRAAYIAAAQKHKATIRAFQMEATREICEHNNLYREKLTNGEAPRVPGIAYGVYFKKMREGGEPTKKEGFDEICKIKFCPQFDNEEHRELFLQFT